jgi:hypothetical protein
MPAKMKTRTHFAHRIDMLDAIGEIRRALELLASCRDGCTEAMLLAHGFTIRYRPLSMPSGPF